MKIPSSPFILVSRARDLVSDCEEILDASESYGEKLSDAVFAVRRKLHQSSDCLDTIYSGICSDFDRGFVCGFLCSCSVFVFYFLVK